MRCLSHCAARRWRAAAGALICRTLNAARLRADVERDIDARAAVDLLSGWRSRACHAACHAPRRCCSHCLPRHTIHVLLFS